jgi:hypothetical protein
MKLADQYLSGRTGDRHGNRRNEKPDSEGGRGADFQHILSPQLRIHITLDLTLDLFFRPIQARGRLFPFSLQRRSTGYFSDAR